MGLECLQYEEKSFGLYAVVQSAWSCLDVVVFCSDSVRPEKAMQMTFIFPGHNDRIDILAHKVVEVCDCISLSGTSRHEKSCGDTHIEVERKGKDCANECNVGSCIGNQKKFENG